MRLPPTSPGWLEAFTAAERPDLWESTQDSFKDLWPTYNNHGNHASRFFGALLPRYAHLQVLLVDGRSQAPVARGRSIPFRWDGTLDDLPRGFDAVGLRAIEEPEHPTTLSALAAEITRDYQGSSLSGLLLQVMSSLATIAGLDALVAPVRPSWKHRYPLTPIERYAAWRRDDGRLFDPWMRVHERLGGRLLRTEAHSLEITASVENWERWTGMQFPEDGRYVFPDGLAPLDVTVGVGRYWEPNVWFLHKAGQLLFT